METGPFPEHAESFFDPTPLNRRPRCNNRRTSYTEGFPLQTDIPVVHQQGVLGRGLPIMASSPLSSAPALSARHAPPTPPRHVKAGGGNILSQARTASLEFWVPADRRNAPDERRPWPLLPLHAGGGPAANTVELGGLVVRTLPVAACFIVSGPTSPRHPRQAHSGSTVSESDVTFRAAQRTRGRPSNSPASISRWTGIVQQTAIRT